MKIKCFYCHRESDRNSLGFELCEFHWLKSNPDRNRWNVRKDWYKWKRLTPSEKEFFLSEMAKLDEKKESTDPWWSGC